MKNFYIIAVLLFFIPLLGFANGSVEYEITEILPIENFDDEDGINFTGGGIHIFHDQDNNGNSSVDLNNFFSPGWDDSLYCTKVKYHLKLTRFEFSKHLYNRPASFMKICISTTSYSNCIKYGNRKQLPIL